MRHVVEKLCVGTFLCKWYDDGDQLIDRPLKLNFDVLIEYFGLTGDFTLLHWQARPKFVRRWGIYCHKSDRYHSCDYNQLLIAATLIEPLQIDESLFKTVPTAVLYMPDTEVVVEGNKVLIKSSELSHVEDNHSAVSARTSDTAAITATIHA
jgi:hypothetical protein